MNQPPNATREPLLPASSETKCHLATKMFREAREPG
jgi:hypothetical protein